MSELVPCPPFHYTPREVAKELLKNNTLKNTVVINLIKFIYKINYLFFFLKSNKQKLLKLYKDQKEFEMT